MYMLVITGYYKGSQTRTAEAPNYWTISSYRPYVDICGIEPFHSVIHIDHRGLFTDLDLQGLLGGEMASILSPKLRGVSSIVEKEMGRYCKPIQKGIESILAKDWDTKSGHPGMVKTFSETKAGSLCRKQRPEAYVYGEAYFRPNQGLLIGKT